MKVDEDMSARGAPRVRADASADRGKMKGAPIAEFLNWYAAEVDHDRLVRALRELGEAQPNAFDVTREGYGLLASVWYPAELVHQLMDRLVGGFDEKQTHELAQRASEFIMGRTLRGVYKVMFSMFATPDRYARHISKLWAQHYDTGTPVIDIVTPTAHDIVFQGWKGHHAFICLMNMASARPIYRAMGCGDVVWRRLSCVSAGGERCASIVRWTGRA